jgi:hypothetical protein
MKHEKKMNLVNGNVIVLGTFFIQRLVVGFILAFKH